MYTTRTIRCRGGLYCSRAAAEGQWRGTWKGYKLKWILYSVLPLIKSFAKEGNLYPQIYIHSSLPRRHKPRRMPPISFKARFKERTWNGNMIQKRIVTSLEGIIIVWRGLGLPRLYCWGQIERTPIIIFCFHQNIIRRHHSSSSSCNKCAKRIQACPECPSTIISLFVASRLLRHSFNLQPDFSRRMCLSWTISKRSFV